MKKRSLRFVSLLLSLLLVFCSCSDTQVAVENSPAIETQNQGQIETNLSENSDDELVIPEYTNLANVEIHNNVPFFEKSELTTEAFERYSDLDNLGRCGVAYANICKEIMPTEERGSIGMVKPSGWHTVKYDCVDGKYLYNRCHLIGYQLSAENANEKNLITGTRYLNIQGMLDYENMVAEYVKSTNHHVLYRVTPMFEGDNLLADGVLMEAQSVEDDTISFCIYAYNVQPGIYIDYLTGESKEIAEATVAEEYPLCEYPNTPETEPVVETKEYLDVVLNTSSKKYHKPTCSSVEKIAENNKETYNGTREWLTENGYTACGICKP